MSPETRTSIGVLLVACLILITMPFEKRYTDHVFEMGQNPGLQFLGGMLVLWLASEDELLGALAFVVLFLWIADVQFFSSFRLDRL
jgi:hypothetical protein